MSDGVLEVPPRARRILVWLAGLTPDELDRIATIVADGDTAPDDLANAVDDATVGGPFQRGRQIVSTLLSLCSVQFSSGLTSEEIATHVAVDLALDLDETGRSRLGGWLHSALSSPAMERLAKTHDVATEYQNIFQDARLVTEARAVFSSSDEVEAYGMVVVHSMKLEYADRSGIHELYLAVNDSDLDKLEEVIARARRKRERLHNMFRSAGITDLTELLD